MPLNPWRRPILAPVYALVVAFLVAAGAGLAVGAPNDTGTVTITLAGGGNVTELAKDAVFTMGDEKQMKSYQLELNKKFGLTDIKRVCVTVKEPWRMAYPTGECVDREKNVSVEFTVVRIGRVHVIGPTKEDMKQTEVRLNNATGAGSETGKPNDDGYYSPRGSLAGQLICVTPPPRWGAPKCQGPVQDTANDVPFELVTQ